MDENVDVEPYQVLFVGTSNSARCVMAESILNHFGAGRFKAYSAGAFPKGEVHPLAADELEKMQITLSSVGNRNWNELAEHGAPELDFVFTLCDEVAGEVCPVWPGSPLTAHWGIPDPAAVEGTSSQKEHAFRAAALAIKRRIELMLALPLQKLDRMAIHQHLKDIGEVPQNN